MNDVGWIESIVAVKEHNHADEQSEKAMVPPDRSVCDFLANVDHERHTRTPQSNSAAEGLLRRISDCRHF
jgi:hypothetical protein